MGFVEWLRGQAILTPVLGMVMGFVYEALHRLPVHLMLGSVSGVQGGTVQKSHEQANAVSHFQYRMLDTRIRHRFPCNPRPPC